MPVEKWNKNTNKNQIYGNVFLIWSRKFKYETTNCLSCKKKANTATNIDEHNGMNGNRTWAAKFFIFENGTLLSR